MHRSSLQINLILGKKNINLTRELMKCSLKVHNYMGWKTFFAKYFHLSPLTTVTKVTHIITKNLDWHVFSHQDILPGTNINGEVHGGNNSYICINVKSDIIRINDDCVKYFVALAATKNIVIDIPRESGSFIFIGDRSGYRFINAANTELYFLSQGNAIARRYLNIRQALEQQITFCVSQMKIFESFMFPNQDKKSVLELKKSDKSLSCEPFELYLFQTYMEKDYKKICRQFGNRRDRRSFIENILFDTQGTTLFFIRFINVKLWCEYELIRQTVYNCCFTCFKI